MKPTFDRRQAATGESGATIDIRRPTTVVRHSTADSRLLNVGRRPAVGRRMSNIVIIAAEFRKVSHEEAMAKAEAEFGE